MKYKIYVLLSIFNFTPSLNASEQNFIGNAGCLVRVENSMLFVKDTWSNRFSLPGGMTEKGEQASETAIRETFEETGLRVKTTRLLAQAANDFFIFECTPESGKIEILAKSTLIPPKVSFNEIKEVKFLDPFKLHPSEWRFQSQAALIQELFRKTISTASFVPKEQEISPLIALELQCVRAFQQLKKYFATPFFLFFSFLGEQYFFMILIPLLWFLFSKRLGVELAFLTFLSTLIHGILKQTFATYRPIHYDPILQLSSANGFGLPSGHTLAVLVVWGFLALHFRLPKRWYIVFGVALLSGLSRIYLGAHFPHDVLGGWLAGGVILWIYARSPKKDHFLPLQAWVCLSLLISIVALVLRPAPETVSVVAVTAGMCIGLLFKPLPNTWKPIQGYLDLSKILHKVNLKLPAFFIGLSGLFLLYALSSVCFPKEATFSLCLVHVTLKYLSLGLWLGFMG